MLDFRNWCEGRGKNPKRDEIAKFWRALPDAIPIQPTNIPPANYQGSTYMYDGLRVTGSSQFINSVASRLKDILNYDGGNTKLFLRYNQQVDKKTHLPLPNSFVFYVQVRDKDDSLKVK